MGSAKTLHHTGVRSEGGEEDEASNVILSAVSGVLLKLCEYGHHRGCVTNKNAHRSLLVSHSEEFLE